jgi:hypothetical protein
MAPPSRGAFIVDEKDFMSRVSTAPVARKG